MLPEGSTMVLMTSLPDWLYPGPEGGWTDDERASFTAAGWTSASLGPLVLRAETAAIAALAIVNSSWQTATIATLNS